jgi:hypothetical protein
MPTNATRKIILTIIVGAIIFLVMVPVVPHSQSSYCPPAADCPVVHQQKVYWSIAYALFRTGMTYVTDGWYGWGSPPPQYQVMIF